MWSIRDPTPLLQLVYNGSVLPFSRRDDVTSGPDAVDPVAVASADSPLKLSDVVQPLWTVHCCDVTLGPGTVDLNAADYVLETSTPPEDSLGLVVTPGPDAVDLVAVDSADPDDCAGNYWTVAHIRRNVQPGYC